jgi:hypothetical protein
VVFYLSAPPFFPLELLPSLCSLHRVASPLELFSFFLSSALAFLVLFSWRRFRPS